MAPPQMNEHHVSDETPLVDSGRIQSTTSGPSSLDISSHFYRKDGTPRRKRIILITVVAALLVTLVLVGLTIVTRKPGEEKPTGPYKLVECQEGDSFFDHYTFLDGPDSLGSAGYNVYVGKDRAKALNIANVTTEITSDVFVSGKNADDSSTTTEKFVYMKSKPTDDGPRESVRLEGKRRYNRGLFILDVRHMPAGCGVWPAFWLTDEDNWPKNGEIDIVEGVNYQSVAKTALHTSDECNMYAHVPDYARTGTWDWATGIPNTWTGEPDFKTNKEADNCWVLAAHQWANQGCVAVSSDERTLGKPLNANGGGIYALEWDPENRYIRSWAFTPHDTVPSNLRDAIETASNTDPGKRVVPDTKKWGLPYGYFAIGETTGCSADHFKNMRIVFNLAFCGTVSGNRYFTDCKNQSKTFNVDNDPIWSCNAWIKSNPKELEEAYWKIRGVYVYERELEAVSKAKEEQVQS